MTRQGGDPATEAPAREARGHVGRGQAGADDEHPVGQADRPDPGVVVGIRHESRRARQPAQRPGHRRRRMGHRQHDEIGVDGGSIRKFDPVAPFPGRERERRGAAMPDGAARHQRREIRPHVLAEHTPFREIVAAQRERSGRQADPLGREPGLEMIVVVADQRHLRRRHVDAMRGLLRRIGQPASQRRARLHHHDIGLARGQRPCQVEGRGRSGKAATQNGDHRPAPR